MIITFEQLPKAVAHLQETVEEIKSLLLAQASSHQTTLEADEFLTIPETAHFLRLTVATVRRLKSSGTIPFIKQEKLVYFCKSDLTNYLLAGRQKSVSEINIIADSFITSSQRKGGRHV